jgi:CheY-like chemotaxis protein
MSDQIQEPGRESFLFPCPFCRNPIETMRAAWCRCIGTRRTFVCERCLRCFCRATPSMVLDFWKQAPEAVWSRRSEPEALGEDMVPSAPLPEGAALPRPLVLVVDDDPVIARLAQGIVESLGYGVVSAKNGAEGYELARSVRPDLVLADALMPKLDGREMCRRLRADPETAAIRTVVMTGVYRSPAARREALMQYGVDEFLSKPLAVSELRVVLEKLTGGVGPA